MPGGGVEGGGGQGEKPKKEGGKGTSWEISVWTSL